MSDEPVADRLPSRAALQQVRSRLAPALAVLSMVRVGAALAVVLIWYLAFVVPDELAALIGASMVGAALIGLAPLAVVYAVIRLPG